MRTRVVLTLLAIVMLGRSVGCASREAVPTTAPPTHPTIVSRDGLYRFNDPRCSVEQQQAIRTATRAVLGTDQPSADAIDRVYFSCQETAYGWSLEVWQFGPDETPAAGGFTGVELNHDFTIRSVVGGA